RSKFGNKAVRAYARAGYHVYPVNPRETEVEGWPAFPSILDVPVERLDRVSVYLPPAVGLKVVEEIARKPADAVSFNPGADAPEVRSRARGLGLTVVAACSIVAIGISPSEL